VSVPATVAEALAAPGTLDQDAPHRLGGGTEKVRSILKAQLWRTCALGRLSDPHPRFVDEGGGLEGLTPLARQLRGCEAPQFTIDRLDQLIAGVVSGLEGLQ